MTIMSFKNLLSRFSNKSKEPNLLTSTTELNGKTTLEKLDNLFKDRSSKDLHPKLIVPTGQKKPSILICLVIVDKLHHEDVWRHFIDESIKVECPFELLIHAKYPERITSEWIQNRLIHTNIQPEWNSPEVVRAMVALLRKGIKDESHCRFLFGTETCLPIHTGEVIYHQVMKDEVSWLMPRHQPLSKWEASNCFLAVDNRIIPSKAVWKSLPGWILLTRKHVIEIINLLDCIQDDLINAWGPAGQWNESAGGVFAPEEVFFPTMLAILGYLREEPEMKSKRDAYHHSEIKRQMITYAEWERIGDANPISYSSLNISLIENIRKSGALFARKFGSDACNLDQWKAVIEKLDDKSMDPTMIKSRIQRLSETYRSWISSSTTQTTSPFTTSVLTSSLDSSDTVGLSVPNNSSSNGSSNSNSSSSSSNHSSVGKEEKSIQIAILMIIVDDLPHECIWRHWSHIHDIQQNQCHKDGLRDLNMAGSSDDSSNTNDHLDDKYYSKANESVTDSVNITINASVVTTKSNLNESHSNIHTTNTSTNTTTNNNNNSSSSSSTSMYISDAEHNNMSIQYFIHAKYPYRIQSTWIQDRLVKTFHMKPEWGSIELTDVMIHLLDEAYQVNPQFDMYIFCSESCIPIQPLSHIYTTLQLLRVSTTSRTATTTTNDSIDNIITINESNIMTDSFNKEVEVTTTNTKSVQVYTCKKISPLYTYPSWIRYTYEPSNGYAAQKQWIPLQEYIPQQFVTKADQWVLISKIHVQAILQISKLLKYKFLNIFKKVTASDEMYIPCALSVLGLLPPCATKADTDSSSNSAEAEVHPSTPMCPVLHRRVTYCNWENNARNPQTYHTLAASDVLLAQQEGCLFFRKLISPHKASLDTHRMSSRDTFATKEILEKEYDWRLTCYLTWLEYVMKLSPSKRIDDTHSTISLPSSSDIISISHTDGSVMRNDTASNNEKVMYEDYVNEAKHILDNLWEQYNSQPSSSRATDTYTRTSLESRECKRYHPQHSDYSTHYEYDNAKRKRYDDTYDTNNYRDYNYDNNDSRYRHDSYRQDNRYRNNYENKRYH